MKLTLPEVRRHILWYVHTVEYYVAIRGMALLEDNSPWGFYTSCDGRLKAAYEEQPGKTEMEDRVCTVALCFLTTMISVMSSSRVKLGRFASRVTGRVISSGFVPCDTHPVHWEGKESMTKIVLPAVSRGSPSSMTLVSSVFCQNLCHCLTCEHASSADIQTLHGSLSTCW